MAGRRESPEQRARRDQALADAEREQTRHRATLWVPGSVDRQPDADVEPVILDPEPTVAFGRLVAPGERATITASAARVDLNDRKTVAAMRRRRQAWQSEAYDYVDEVGEIGYSVGYLANLVGKIRLFAAVRPDPSQAPIAVDDDESPVDPTTTKLAVATLERLRSIQGGQSGIVRDVAFNLEVAGELWLHGHEDPDTGEEDWNVRSVDELVVQGDQFVLRDFPGVNVFTKIPAEDVVIRLWEKHPRFSQLARCAMRGVLSEAESLLLLSRQIRSEAKSRLSAGLLLVPEELSFGPANPTEDDDGADPLESELMDVLVTPIQQEGSAAAVAPGLVRGKSDYLKPDVFRHLTFAREMDATLDQRIEGRIMRVARGLNLPVEVVRGLPDTTFANAAVSKRAEWDDHGEPRAILVCDALTAGYFQAALIEAGVARDVARSIFVWFDPSGAISSPEQTDFAEKDHEDGLISDETRRRVHGFSEADAPSDDELIRRMIFHASRMDPFILSQLLVITGIVPGLKIPAPAGGVLSPGGDVTNVPPAAQAAELARLMGADERTARALQRYVTSVHVPHFTERPARSGEGAKLGRRLATIDRGLRQRLQAHAEAALRRALERAGNKVRTAAGRPKSGGGPAARAALEGVAAADVCATLGRSVVAALGIGDDGLLGDEFDQLASDFAAWAEVSRADAVAAVEKVYGQIPDATKIELAALGAAATARAADDLRRRMLDLAAARLYEPDAGGLAPVGEADVSAMVPAGLARAVVAVAGGAQVADGPGGMVSDGDGGPAFGVALGPIGQQAIASVGGGVEGYVWDYGGAPRVPFQAHLDLDGTPFVNWDDPVLTNEESWPEVPFLQPGDHGTCVCDSVPLLLDPSDVDLGGGEIEGG